MGYEKGMFFCVIICLPPRLNLALDKWLMTYCVWDAVKRKKIPPSISMKGGAIVGSTLQDMNQFNLTINQVMNGR